MWDEKSLGLNQAPRDSDFALEYVRREARTPEQQQAVMAALTFKCDMLWAMLDALHFAYVAPGTPPPGVFVPRTDTVSQVARHLEVG